MSSFPAIFHKYPCFRNRTWHPRPDTAITINSTSPHRVTETGKQSKEPQTAAGLNCEHTHTHTPPAHQTLAPQALQHQVSQFWAKILHRMLHLPPSWVQLVPNSCGCRESFCSNSPRTETKQGAMYPQPAAPKFFTSHITAFFPCSPFPCNPCSTANSFKFICF